MERGSCAPLPFAKFTLKTWGVYLKVIGTRHHSTPFSQNIWDPPDTQDLASQHPAFPRPGGASQQPVESLSGRLHGSVCLELGGSASDSLSLIHPHPGPFSLQVSPVGPRH